MPEGIKKGTLYTLLGLGGSGLIMIAFNGIAARVLGPSGFGLFSVLYSWILIISALLGGGINVGTVKFISQFEAKGDKESIYATMKNGAILVGILFFLFLVCSPYLEILLRNRHLDGNALLFIVLVITILLRLPLIFVRSILCGLREFKFNALTNVGEYLSMLSFLWLFCLLFKWQLKGAAYSLISAEIIALAMGFIVLFSLRTRFIKFKKIKELGTFIRFAIPAGMINFLTIFLLRSGPLLIKACGEGEANQLVAVFAAGLTLVNAARLLFSALFTSLFPHLSRAEVLKDKEKLREYVQKSILFVAIVSVFMIIGFWLFGPFVLRVIFGKAFVPRRMDLVLIATMSGLFFLAQPFHSALLAKGLTIKVLVSWIIGSVVLLLFVYFSNLDALFRIEVGLCLANLVPFILMFGMLRRELRMTS